MAIASNLGFPRIGPNRELKKALESFWAGKSSEADLVAAGREIRRANWTLQRERGIAHIPSNDFSLYDHVLDTAAMVGAIPRRYGFSGDRIDLATYFAMARGGRIAGRDVPAMEMTKWFDTNYHYIVPELEPDMAFRLCSTKPVDEFREAAALGIRTRPVLVGPVTFLLRGKRTDGAPVAGHDGHAHGSPAEHAGAGSNLDLLDALLPVYEDVLRRLAEAGAEWVQIDEPELVMDLPLEAAAAYEGAYARLAKAAPNLKLLLATYFDDARHNLDLAFRLRVAGVHVDLVRAPSQLDRALVLIRDGMILSLGVVDGRNVWLADLGAAVARVRKAVAALGDDRVLVAPSCSLLHSPVDLANEREMDQEIRQWLSFAAQKLDEISVVARAASGDAGVAGALGRNREALERRLHSPRIHNPAVKDRLAGVTPDMARRASPYADRRRVQAERIDLPPFPTTTIGSFPQTAEVRKVRAAFKKGERSAAEYDAFLREEIARAIRFQDEIGLDVLVHGEFERNDMVEYFGEQLDGFAVSESGWVQSYGSRCVKPPIIYGDVRRPAPMTVDWIRHAQSLTKKPVKGMLTGPVTILQWSFVRDDQPRRDTCAEIALAIRDEVADLAAAGIRIIQIDEPALREGLPLRGDERGSYLERAVRAFRLAASGVADDVQIHTHMCYSEFNDIIEHIAAMDADVISIEASRSRMELLDAFVDYRYPNEIGPGVYDIHSPRVPAAGEMTELLRQAIGVLRPEQLWVNPDCGLKTRRWEEVRPALAAMVEAARAVRREYVGSGELRAPMAG